MSSCNPEARRSIKPEEKKEEEEARRAASTVLKGRCKDRQSKSWNVEGRAVWDCSLTVRLIKR